MKPLNAKKIFIPVLFIGLLIVPITVLVNTPLAILRANTLLLYISLLQRMFGLASFVLITFQIIIGAYMLQLTQKFGGWIFKFHQTQGIIAYALIFLHPLSFLLFNFISTHIIDPFYIYSDFCLLCETRQELFYTFGRLAFWLISATVLVAKYRTTPFFRRNWRYFHISNYFIFILVVIHAWFVGSDVVTFPFVIIYFAAVLAVLFVLITKIIPPLKKISSKLE